MAGIENPAFEEMRSRLAERLETDFGHTVIDSERIDVPGAEGGIEGQLQTDDGAGGRLVFYLRPRGVSPVVPAYLSRLARSSYQLQDQVRVCIVVDESDDTAESDATACGAGLLILSEEALIQVVAPEVPTAGLTEDELGEFGAQVRQQIVSAAQLRLSELQAEFHAARRVVDETSGEGKKLLADITQKHAACTQWQDRLLERWGRAERRHDRSALEAIQKEALEGEPDTG